MDYVRRRGKIYCAVITVPADLRLLIGKSQIWRSLKTKNYDLARSEAKKVLLAVDQYFWHLRNNKMESRLINGMVAEYGLESIDDFVKIGKGLRSASEEYNKVTSEFYEKIRSSDNARDIAKTALNDVAKIYQELENSGDYNKVPFATQLACLGISKLRLNGFIADDVEISPEEHREVVAAFAETQKYILKVQAERLQGITEIDSDFQYRLLKKWNKDKPVAVDIGLPLSEVLREYGEQWKPDNDNQARIKRKKAELKRLEESFRECFCKVLGVREIDEDKALEWRNYLQYEYHSDRELVLKNKAVDNYRKTISAVFNWAKLRKQKYVDNNPFATGLALPAGDASEHSRVFSDAELQKYVEVLEKNYNSEELEMTWLPLIMMFSGMRCNEVAQLYLDDVQETPDGISFFRITTNKERKQMVKCKASERDIPVHNTLLELGFMDYVKRMRSVSEVQLFPHCKCQKTGYYYSDSMSTRLNAAINLNISEDRKLRLYSLRANFRTAIITRCTNNNIDSILAGSTSIDGYIERVLDEIMGHSITGGTGKKTYTKLAVPVKAKVLTLLEYPIDLTKLKRLLST